LALPRTENNTASSMGIGASAQLKARQNVPIHQTLALLSAFLSSYSSFTEICVV
jgi:hypothetical protein